MSEKRQYEKPALVNCGTMVEQTGCWDGTNNQPPISSAYLGTNPSGLQFHGGRRGR